MEKKEYFTNSKEYNKKYYNEHKEHIKELMKECHKKMRIKNLLDKLNNNFEFQRFPFSRIKKYGIKKDEQNNKYFIE